MSDHVSRLVAELERKLFHRGTAELKQRVNVLSRLLTEERSRLPGGAH